MHRRIRLILAAVAVLLVCRAAADQAGATVIRDGKAAPSNPAVEAGGKKPLGTGGDRVPDNIPYSLIGAFPISYPWFEPCLEWPWQFLGRIRWHRPPALPVARPLGRPIRRPPRRWP